jgi:glycosyltransferase involved in cell wall biosynthesis
LSVVVVIVARNEEEHIKTTLSTIRNQDYRLLKQIIVVDDGSTDKTSEIAETFGCTVISLPFHEKSLVARPQLAERWNAGFTAAMKYNPDYIFTSGADHKFPPSHLQTLVERMRSDPSLVIASGVIGNGKNTIKTPTGSGRLIKTSFWRKAKEIAYPIEQGWEAWILFKAMEMGFKVRVFQDLTTEARPVSMTPHKALGHGKGMWALGYNWKYAVARIGLLLLKKPKSALFMLSGWLFHRGCNRLDVAPYVNKMQSKRFFTEVKERLS